MSAETRTDEPTELTDEEITTVWKRTPGDVTRVQDGEPARLGDPDTRDADTDESDADTDEADTDESDADESDADTDQADA